MEELDILVNALELSPENKILRNHIAKIQFDTGLYEEALENYKILYSTDGKDVQALEYMLKSLLNLEVYDEIQELVERELNQRIDWAFGFFVLAKCLYFKEEYEEAMKNYEKSVDIDSELEDIEFHKNLLQFTSSQKVKLKVLEFSEKEVCNEEFVKTQISFKDVGGMEEVKENIQANIIFPFRNPEIFKVYGKSAGGGILLYGPPGCGKTFISLATAGECNAHFVTISITDVLDMYIGESEKNLHTIFETARMKAPAVIFIDEIDALGGSRQSMRSSTSRTLTNQLLMELDSTQNNNKNLLVIGATNTPWSIDSALRRPGRFDRILFIPPPDIDARVEILKLHMKDKPCKEIDYLFIAKSLSKYSGADIKGVCDVACQSCIKKAMAAGKIVPITTEDLLDAIKVIKPSTIEWLSTAKNYATYSNQSGLYDDVLNYFKINI
ncbi:ATP-binding protein [Clostridium peptidivorans]|uniref:ATP-binding protein n=1 Tax=Clostridium peptidivorans TaxID=100174 RepID=UPI001A9A3243|nr:ATP-binding protein [Clostridium peptidivorans]